eukprot:TRINITY_DN1975_c0_g1_i12.p1 TRINITY_DN1975_c0_g1~~TRINITY_DN1975_c0_g1_i12.p1  ORF type:complete len:219 (+),score=37.35 TRINITY_DN1975_c0_g1_i12:91-747(+)
MGCGESSSSKKVKTNFARSQPKRQRKERPSESGVKTEDKYKVQSTGKYSEEHNREEGKEEMRSAVAQGNLPKVKEILAEGYPIDLPLNDQKTTAVHFACNRGQNEVLKHLVALGANVNARDRKEWTPLILASSSGALDCVLTLLKERSIDAAAKDLEGKDALKFAEQRLMDVRMQNRADESEKYEKIISALKKRVCKRENHCLYVANCLYLTCMHCTL